MKALILALALALTTQAHAMSNGGNSYGGHGARAGVQAGAGQSAGQSAASAGGNGGQYMSESYLQHQVDRFQPWPQEEMKQFAKSRFIPYGQVEDQQAVR